MTSEKYRRSNDALFSSIGSDIVALHVHNGHCYGMEDVTAQVWNLLGEPADIPGICDRLLEIYEVKPATCRSEVERLIMQFKSEGLIETVPA